MTTQSKTLTAMLMALPEQRREQLRGTLTEWLDLSGLGRTVDAAEAWRTIELLVPVEMSAAMERASRAELGALAR